MSELNEVANRVHDQVAGINRVTLFPATSKRIVDEAGAPGTTYVGVAAAGTATSDSAWLVERITVSGTTTTIDHATGVWDDRASLSYE
jgi:hypothetical protein